MVKAFLKLLQHKRYDDHGAPGTRGHKICINDDHGLTLSCFKAMLNLFAFAFELDSCSISFNEK